MTISPEPDNAIRIAILGAGSFGSVLANILAGNGYAVSLWLRSQESVDEIARERSNPRYFTDFRFHQSIHFSCALDEVLAYADYVVLAIPSHAYRSLLAQIRPLLNKKAVLVSTAKGIDQDSFKLMSEIVQEELVNNQVVVLSGPNIAMEIAKGELSGTVVASHDQELNKRVQGIFSSPTFRVYDNPDPYGVELAGALKNIYAIASGMSSALGIGYNARSMLMTRSLAEMSRFAVSRGANPMTFLGLAGVGDLFVTCTSPQSRNFRLGELVAKGMRADEAIKLIGSTVEGYATVRTVAREAERLGIYMPLASALEQVLYHHVAIADVVKALMLGENNHDVEFLMPGEA